MAYTTAFWSRYLRLQRATVALFALVELSVWGYGVAFSWKPFFWDPAMIIEYTQRWPPLVLTAACLIVVWIVGVAAERLHVPAVPAWLAGAVPGCALAAYLVWCMYESTT
jgi:hypothetical protein